MAVAGASHFALPGPFERIVPRWFPWRKEAVQVSGAAELLAAGLLVVPRTSRTGAGLTAAILVAVYPANVQMAIDASPGRSQVPMPAWAAWARVPLQLAMIRSALELAR